MKRCIFVVLCIALFSSVYAGNIFSIFKAHPDSIYIERDFPDSIYKIQTVVADLPTPDSIYYSFVVKVFRASLYDYIGDTSDYSTYGDIYVCFPRENDSVLVHHTNCQCDSLIKTNDNYVIDSLEYVEYSSFLNCCWRTKEFTSLGGTKYVANEHPDDTLFLYLKDSKGDSLVDSVIVISNGYEWRSWGYEVWDWVIENTTCYDYKYCLELWFKGKELHTISLGSDKK